MKPAALRIDLAALDPAQFKLVEEEGEVLVIPRKDKFRWGDDELHLRSLVTDRAGNILSAGFPKFFNLGEHPGHDGDFAAAVAAASVTLTEKMDGSLLVADRIAGRARLRTRGQRTLGEFGPLVEAVVAARYPRLMDFVRTSPLLDDHSLVFEFVSPERAVVLQYPEAALYLLGAIDRATVTPRWDDAALAGVSEATGVALPPTHPMGEGLEHTVSAVRGWTGREGVVARFTAPHGAPRLLKIKTADYLRLHAYRSRLGNGRGVRIAWLLGVTSEADVFPAFARYGLDWEATQFALADVRPWLARRAEMLTRFADFEAALRPHLGHRAKEEKKRYIERLRALTSPDGSHPGARWFTAGTRLFDVDRDDALLVMDADLMDEAPPTLRGLRARADDEVRAMLSTPVRDDDG